MVSTTYNVVILYEVNSSQYLIYTERLKTIPSLTLRACYFFESSVYGLISGYFYEDIFYFVAVFFGVDVSGIVGGYGPAEAQSLCDADECGDSGSLASVFFAFLRRFSHIMTRRMATSVAHEAE